MMAHHSHIICKLDGVVCVLYVCSQESINHSYETLEALYSVMLRESNNTRWNAAAVCANIVSGVLINQHVSVTGAACAGVRSFSKV